MIGAALVQVPAAAQTESCGGQPATIVGTTGNDRLVGTPNADVIVGFGGADVIIGRGGNDIICGGFGRDSITGGAGDDLIVGGPGPDTLTGGPGDDMILGGLARDTLIGSDGNDTIVGGPSGDSLMGGAGSDTLLGGLGPDRVVGGVGVDEIAGGGGRDVCDASDSYSTCEAPTSATARLFGNTVSVDRVIHISIDGLRTDHVTDALAPTLTDLMDQGASTLNARTDPDSTKTLPNHTAQFTGRPVTGDRGHGVVLNEDLGGTVHDTAGVYVASVFDVANDHGVRTAVYAGKEKFELHNRTWNGQFGRADTIGENNGRDKIDIFKRNDPVSAVAEMLDDLETTALGRDDAYIFVHIRLPDSAGHASGWASPDYRRSITESDDLVGQIVDRIDSNPAWATSTGIIVTSDHGGPTGETLHADFTNRDTYRIPFIVSAPGVAAGSDLYSLNRFGRAEPGAGQLPLTGQQPIRGHEAGNLALDLLGLPAIDGSVFDAAHDLRLN